MPDLLTTLTQAIVYVLLILMPERLEKGEVRICYIIVTALYNYGCEVQIKGAPFLGDFHIVFGSLADIIFS
jgi:hypothetical protein